MEDSELYPHKPELIESEAKTNWGATIFSICLFTLVFMYMFSNQIDFIIALVLVLFIHELGHFLAMKFFGYRNVRMLFIPLMGAFVHGKKDLYSQRESFIMVGAGPFPGMIIGFLLMFFSQDAHSTFMFHTGMLFFVLNIINLVPLDPLDGGQLLKLFINKHHQKFLMIFTLLSSIAIIIIGFFLDSKLLMLFGFIMGFRVRALQKNHFLHELLRESAISFNTTYKELSNKDFWKIKQIIVDRTPNLKQYLEIADQEESDMLLASQVNSVLVTPVVKDASLFLKIIILLLWGLSLASPFILWFYLLDLNWVQHALQSW